MEFLFDCANLEEIRKSKDIFPVTGVTTNPSILKAEGKIDFFPHLREIRRITGPEKTLHVQTLARDAEGILREAEAIFKNIDDAVYIKIPVTETGLKAMRLLKKQKAGVTATAIYTPIQGFMAIAAGADFIAPYCNRIESLGSDPYGMIRAFRGIIDENHAETKILAASFKNAAQVIRAFLAGAQTATVAPSILHEAFTNAAVEKAVEDFIADWKKTQGDVSITEL